MKTTSLLAFCLLCTLGAFGQNLLTPSSFTSTFQVTGHAQQAVPTPMAQEKSLLEGSGQVYTAHGERPLWEVAPIIHETPLGDSARALKKEHEAVKRAEIVWEN